MAHGMLTKRKYSLEAQFAQPLNFGNDQALIFFYVRFPSGCWFNTCAQGSSMACYAH